MEDNFEFEKLCRKYPHISFKKKAKRDGLPSGLITNKEEWKAVFEKSPIINEFGIRCKCIEIPNPNPEFQA